MEYLLDLNRSRQDESRPKHTHGHENHLMQDSPVNRRSIKSAAARARIRQRPTRPVTDDETLPSAKVRTREIIVAIGGSLAYKFYLYSRAKG